MHHEIIVYGTTWCGDCHRSRRLLDRLHIRYTWVDVDENLEALETVRNLNNGRRIVPTIVFANGDVLVEPTDSALAARLGVQV